MNLISVCVATCGPDPVWPHLAHTRAIPSAQRQTIEPEIIWTHADTLHDARNQAATRARGDWLIFLDADDELDEHYIDATTQIVDNLNGPALIQPATLGIHPDGTTDPAPVLIPAKPLLDGNYLVIGTAIRADQFHRVGGFRDLPLYEDWDLWIRAWLDGATIHANPAAVYRVHVNPTGRNTVDVQLQHDTYHRIRNTYRQRHGPTHS